MMNSYLKVTILLFLAFLVSYSREDDSARSIDTKAIETLERKPVRMNPVTDLVAMEKTTDQTLYIA